MMADNPMVWMVQVNGIPINARMLPADAQRICYEKGLIPYVPADREAGEPDYQ